MELSNPLPEPLTITIVYDNVAFDERLKTAWGFSALVEYHGHKLLFDTGGDGPTLLANMRALEIDPNVIDTIVLSHAHGDHTGGLNALLDHGVRPVVYLPAPFPAAFKRQVSEKTKLVEVVPGQMIAEDIFTTGEMGQGIVEQALLIKTEKGLVIITGCAHPGIVAIVEQAQSLLDEPVRLVMGGFHLSGKSQAEIDVIVKSFRHLEVAQVAPCHCTGDLAISSFMAEYKTDFLRAGAGRIIRLDAPD